MSDVLNDVQAQHAKYSEMLGEKQKYLTQIKDQIKRLRVELKTVISHVHELTGAVNMGSQVIQKLQETQQAATPVTVEGEVA